MAGVSINDSVTNQTGVPMVFALPFASFPVAGVPFRIGFRTDAPYGIYMDNGSSFVLIAEISGGGVLSLAAIGSAANANGGTITGTILNLQPADASFGGVITTGVQSFAGAKTFNGIVSAPTASPGTNTTQLASTAFVTAADAALGALYLLLTGGTLTGGLTGTSATFTTATISGAVTTAINSQPVTTTHYINHRLGNGYITGRGTTGETFISSNTDLFTATITGASSYLSQNAGILFFFNAPSVTAGSTPTFTQQFTIAASGTATFSGNLGCSGAFIQLNQTEIFPSAGGSNRAYAFSLGNVTAGDFVIMQGSSATGGTYTNRLVITSTGGVTCNGTLGINGTADNIKSGTYTPTAVNISNTSARSAYLAQYMRIGNVVTVSGQALITTVATGTTEISLTLPISSTFASSIQASGTANNDGTAGIITSINSTTTVSLKFTSPGALSLYLFVYQYSYQVI